MSDLNFPFDDTLPPDDNRHLHAENDFLLRKLQEEFGATHFFEENVPATLQNAFLKTVLEAEGLCSENQRKVPIFQRLQFPYCLDDMYLTDEGVNHELRRLQSLLFEYHIVVDSIYENDPRIMYRFILNELFNQLVDDVPVSSYYVHFCYEEFFPNDIEELRTDTIEFIHELLDQSLSMEYNMLSAVMRCRDRRIQREVFLENLDAFYENFRQLHLKYVEIADVDLQGKLATVHFNVNYEAVMHDSDVITIDGNGFFRFTRESVPFWSIEEISFPGLVI